MREIEFWKFFFLERGKVRQTAREQAQTGLDETRVVLYRMREIKEPDLKTKTIVNLINTFQQATRVEVKVSWAIFLRILTQISTWYCIMLFRNLW